MTEAQRDRHIKPKAKNPRAGQTPDQAARLALIRDVMGYGGDRQASEWAARSGFSQNAWHHWEKDAFKMSERMVDKLCDYVRNGMTADYIRRGLLGNMSYSFVIRLRCLLSAHGLVDTGDAHLLRSPASRADNLSPNTDAPPSTTAASTTRTRRAAT